MNKSLFWSTFFFEGSCVNKDERKGYIDYQILRKRFVSNKSFKLNVFPTINDPG
jgi:hypothetical protein